MASAPLLLGHRGARATKSVAENTPASFELALQHGCVGFEFDVRLTAAGHAVICHDAEVDGVTVSCATPTQLRHLPQLSDVLLHFARRAFLDIELKVPGLESQVLVALREHRPERGCVVSSFLPEVLLGLSAHGAAVSLGIICDQRKDLDGWRDLPVAYVILHYSLITSALVEEVHRADKILFAWTVNDQASMLRLAGWGVDGIISDQTELLVRTFR